MQRAGAGPASKAVARTRTAAKPDFSVSDYSPGPIRSEADAQAGAIATFLRYHPEYASLDHDTIVQAMNVRQRRGRKAAELRYDEGIPEGFESRRSDESGPALAEEL